MTKARIALAGIGLAFALVGVGVAWAVDPLIGLGFFIVGAFLWTLPFTRRHEDE